MSTASLDQRVRLKYGKEMESKIADSLKQCGLQVGKSSDREDRLKKVDRWLMQNGTKIPLQIKFRESGDDLLFEVFDTFHGWNDHKNKIGRDMEGIAKLYAVLMRDGKTIIMVPTQPAKDVINEMLCEVRRSGWGSKSYTGATLTYRADGCNLTLKLQMDPFDGRSKMIAYIPQEYFAKQAQTKSYRMF